MTARFSLGRPSPYEATQSRGGLSTEHDVFCNAKLRQETELLMHENNAPRARLGWSRQVNALLANRDCSAVILKEAGEHAHQCGLACSVLSDKCVDLAAEQIQINRVDRLSGPERLGNRTQSHGGI